MFAARSATGTAFAAAVPAIVVRGGSRALVRASAASRPPSIARRLQRAEELLAAARASPPQGKQSQSQKNAQAAAPPRRARQAPTTPGNAAGLAPRGGATPPDIRGEEMAARASKSADIGPRYDVDVAVEMFRNRGWYVRSRQVQIVFPLVSFVARVVLDVQSGREAKNRQRRAEEFLSLIASLGPAFIKAGQALSSRPDLLPAEYLTELQKLQDRLAPFPNEIAFKLIEEELGQSVDEVFEYIDPIPVAAASIGQVYCARLRGTGEKVAVKVQRPDCEKIISLDIHILRNVSGTVNRMFKLIGRDIELQSIIEEFGKLIYEEIDYISEARNAERFLELYGALPNVNVPRVFWRYTKRRVLTMQWMEGVRLTSAELDGRNSELVRAMVQCSLRQMLENGYFHADTHLGNLLAHEGSLTYLDFGMMSMVEPKQRYGIIEAVVHMVNRDFEALTMLYVRLGFLPPDIDRTPISDALAKALPDVLGASVGELNFKSVIDKLGSVMYQYPFRLPPYYTAVIRCLGVLEGVAIQVDPKFKILNESYPYIASRLLTDPAPELQEALQALLFDAEGHPRWSRLESLLENAAATDDYDVSLAVEQLISFLLSPKGKVIRYTLADDLTNELDLLGADLSRYYLSMAVQAGSALGIRIPSTLSAMPAPKPTAAMENLDKLSKILSRSRGFNPNKLTPVIRRVLREPEGQRIGLEVAVSLAERITSRAIRFAFGLQGPDSPPSSVRTSPADATV
jgi:predicted unusual protein kinase regulating ubiquinone biosynthesis (AarF/ABC1/UbiB family)